MNDVEYLAAGSGASGDDDVLDVGPRRRLPRWVIVLAALFAAVLVAGAIIARAHHVAHRAAPSAGPTASGAAPPVARVIDGESLGPGVLGVTMAAGRLYVLTPAAVTSFELPTLRRTASAPLTPVLSYTAYFTLIYDTVDASIWVVPIGGALPGKLMEFDAADLHHRRDIRLPTTLASAAVLDGEIYLGTAEEGLLGVAPGARTPVSVLDASDGVGPLVADPSRDRLLYLTDGSPTRVRSWSPRGSQSSAQGRLAFFNADLVVAGASIWAGGFGAHRAVLVRLDPQTLMPVQSAERLVAQLGSGAVLAAGGSQDLFIRAGGTVDPLWCVDARTGEIEQHWAGPAGAVAAGAHQVVVAAASGVRSLGLRGCAG